LLDGRQKHVELVDHVVNTGENLCTMLPGDYHHVIHHQTGALRRDCDQLFTSVMASQRQLEVSLVEWTSYVDRVSQIEEWITRMRMLVNDDLPLAGNLQEKKAQLHTFKVMMPVVFLYCSDISVTKRRNFIYRMLFTDIY